MYPPGIAFWTQDCLQDPSMINWIIQCHHFALHCRVLPIIADEEFHVPGTVSDFHKLAQSPHVSAQAESLLDYLAVVRVLFTQIASRFSTRYSSETTLNLVGGFRRFFTFVFEPS